jgi:hypothetical protein
MCINRGLRNSGVYILMWGVFAISSCALPSATTNSGYSEDLSVHRPRVDMEVAEEEETVEVVRDVTPVNDQTAQIEAKLDQITEYSRTSNSAQGFTIQVYSGTSREQASQVKAQVYKILPESRPETKYEQPIYRVRVGEFVNRLEAQNTYALLASEFPQAIVIPTRIRLN